MLGSATWSVKVLGSRLLFTDSHCHHQDQCSSCVLMTIVTELMTDTVRDMMIRKWSMSSAPCIQISGLLRSYNIPEFSVRPFNKSKRWMWQFRLRHDFITCCDILVVWINGKLVVTAGSYDLPAPASRFNQSGGEEHVVYGWIKWWGRMGVIGCIRNGRKGDTVTLKKATILNDTICSYWLHKLINLISINRWTDWLGCPALPSSCRDIQLSQIIGASSPRHRLGIIFIYFT